MTSPRLLKGRWPSHLDLVVFDFDGVMTDNTVWVLEDGTEAVRCHRGDGLGVARLLAAGFQAMVLSTETNPVVSARCVKLRLPFHQGCSDKTLWLGRFLQHQGMDPTRVAFVGNDINDIECLRLVGLSVAVADAHPSVKREAALVLQGSGGQGGVRELCDLLISYSLPSRPVVVALDRSLTVSTT